MKEQRQNMIWVAIYLLIWVLLIVSPVVGVSQVTQPPQDNTDHYTHLELTLINADGREAKIERCIIIRGRSSYTLYWSNNIDYLDDVAYIETPSGHKISVTLWGDVIRDNRFRGIHFRVDDIVSKHAKKQLFI